MSRRAALMCLLVLCCCMVIGSAALPALADMGPKPAVTVEFKGLDGKACVTLLSLNRHSGPAYAYRPEEELGKVLNWTTSDGRTHYWGGVDDADYSADADSIWQAFVDYKDEDGYSFLQTWWELDSSCTHFSWNYYAPRNFKLLVYLPDSGSFISSGAYSSYAYHSYYTVDLSTETPLVLKNSYDYFSEILALVFRIAATILVELLVALIFRLSSYRQVLTIILTNLATQTLLNLGLNLISYFSGGGLLLIMLFFPAECCVFAAEAATYSIVFRKQRTPVWKSIVYALCANVVSAGLGIGLCLAFPFLL